MQTIYVIRRRDLDGCCTIESAYTEEVSAECAAEEMQQKDVFHVYEIEEVALYRTVR